MATRTHDDYTVAWVCALALEMAAVKTMLDEIDPRLHQPETDENTYTLGRVSGHNVVIVCLPSGIYGTTSAATVLAQALQTFPSIRFGLMVGIGGGAPNSTNDIRLGDVVISTPTETSGGVIQYDHGKVLPDGRFQRTGLLNKPPQILLTAVSDLRSNQMMKKGSIEGIVHTVLQKYQDMNTQFSRPDKDWLFNPTYHHQCHDQDSNADCLMCDQHQLVDRPFRESDEPHIHYGLIGSANQVMKDAWTRDSIAQELNIICFEMEAAGLMNQLPSIVIRGICDYCDSHKNKWWQGYAALTAAAYAKTLLSVVPVTYPKNKDLSRTDKGPESIAEANLRCLRSLAFREQEYRYNEIHSAVNTCTWLLDDPKYKEWLASDRGLLWIKGNPGTGKSVLMKFAVQQMASMTNTRVVSFFIHGRGTEMQRTPLGLFRGLLNSLLGMFPDYLSQLTQVFENKEMRFGSYEESRWNWMENDLQEQLSNILSTGTTGCLIYIFIDAIDECGQDAARSLLTYFKNILGGVQQREGGGGLKICLSSRHYPILGHHTIPTILVEEKNAQDIQQVIEYHLEQIESEADRKWISKEILFKAQGGFQWAVLVCNRAIDEMEIGIKREYLQRKLTTLPDALDGLYSDILCRVHESEKQQMVKLFQWVLFAERPLSAQELRDALSIDHTMDPDTKIRSHNSWSDTVPDFERHVKHLSKGLVEFQTRDIWEQYEPGAEDSDREAQFTHQSVADFLLDKFLKTITYDRNLSQSVVGAGHFEISRACLKYMTLSEVLEDAQQMARVGLWGRYQLIPYVVKFLFQHIKKVEQQNIPQVDILPRIHWGQRSVSEKLANLWTVSNPNNVYAPRRWPCATALHVAVTFGSKSTFDDLLQKGNVTVDGRDNEGNTPLLLALKEGHRDMALALIDRAMKWDVQHKEAAERTAHNCEDTGQQSYHVVDVNSRNNDNDTPLDLALEENDMEVIFKLLDAGVDINNPETQTRLLFGAIRNKNETLLRRLIEHPAELDGAVCFALEELCDDEDILQIFVNELLHAGANTRKSDCFDQPPDEEENSEFKNKNAFIIASTIGNASIMKLLLETRGLNCLQGEYSKAEMIRNYERSLLSASEFGHQNVVKLMLECGVDPNCQKDSSLHEPAIYLASERGHASVVKLLLEHGADLNSHGYSSQRLLIGAVLGGHESVVKLLLENGADPNCQEDSSLHEPAIYLASERGHASVVKLLLEHGADLNSYGYSSQRLLIGAVLGGHESVVKLLLEHGADPNYPEDFSLHEPAIYLPSERGHESMVKLLLEHGADPDYQEDFSLRQTALHLASGRGDEAVVKLLLEHRADPNHKDYQDQTALHLASESGDEAVVKLLLEHRADPNHKDYRDRTALHLASDSGHEAVVKLLLEHRADPNHKNSYNQTALHLASDSGHEAVVKLLLEYRADPNHKNYYNQTALHLASESGDEAVVKLLLEYRANPNHKDSYDQTALHLASESGVVKLLLEYRADPNHKDSYDQTALDLALDSGHEVVVNLLLEYGADPNSQDNSSLHRTVLHLASERGYDAVTKLLLEHGADPNYHDDSFLHRTALHLASERGHASVVKLLLEHGADPNYQEDSSLRRTALCLASERGHEEVVELLRAHRTHTKYEGKRS